MYGKKLYKFILSVFTLVLLLLSKSSAQSDVGGYVDKFSVTRGDSITFYLSTTSLDSSHLAMSFFQITDDVKYISGTNDITAGYQKAPDSSFANGCNWNPTYTFTIPSDWKPGVYRAEFHRSSVIDTINNVIDTTFQSYGVLFIVKPKTLASTSDILLVVATNTYQAYNTYAGHSLYVQYPDTGGYIPKAQKVSMQRPAALPLGSLGSADFYKYERRFINWAFTNNIDLEYASKYDLDIDSAFLNNYKVVFIVGHNEYWSMAERKQCETYLDNGGKIIILSGNTCWWQVRFEDNGKTMVCYKDTTDPISNRTQVTTNWWRSPVNIPENSFTGVNFKDGGYVNFGAKLPKSSGYGDYAALNTQYWVFDGTGLKDGDEFGYDDAIVGYETDGTPFHWDSIGLPVVDGYENTPLNYRVLGTSPAAPFDSAFIADSSYSYHYPHATMGLYYRTESGLFGQKGAVFNGATTDWSDGLLTDPSNNNYPDPVVDRITKNVLNKFLSNKFPPEITAWSPSIKQYKWVNIDPIYCNVRDTLIADTTTLHLFISAQNPFPSLQGTVKYFWKGFADSLVSDSSTYEFKIPETFAAVKRFTVTGYAYNKEDTASVSWNIFTSPLAILNSDSTGVKDSTSFSYQIKVFNYYQDALSFSLSGAPDSLSIDSNGLITGNFGEMDTTFNFSIIVNNQHSNSDTLKFKLVVSKNITGIDNQENLPDKFYLSQNYPNPFNPSTTIEYNIPKAGLVTLKIYDILGREVRTIVNKEKTAGSYKISFNASSFASGVYFYRLTSGGFTLIKKMVLLK